MKISAIICTHNGQRVLKKALRSLMAQTLAKEDYEILVVDNASTDGTREIIRQFDKEGNLRYVSEHRLGLSHARNTGWQNARGEIVAYLDDDAIACPEWLERIIQAFRAVPKAGAVGGKIEPIWEAEPPTWINDFMQRFLSVLDLSETPIFLNDHKYLVGANISFPRMILEMFSGFQVNLGRKGKSLISNEEVDLINKIKGIGLVVFYDPAISVKHFVPASRLNTRWFRKRWFNQGVSNAILYCNANSLPAYDKRNEAIKQLKYILRRPQDLLFASFPSKFPHYAEKSHNSMVRLGFVYGLFKANV